MYSASFIRLWFVCKPCSITFQNLKDFIKHKKEKHLEELLRNKCIVFEESVPETGDAVESDPSYETVHVLPLKENTAWPGPDLSIENAPAESILNSQVLVRREPPCYLNDNDRNDDPAAVQNILGLNSDSYDLECQDSDSNQNAHNNGNNCNEDVKPNPDPGSSSNYPEVKCQVSTYEFEDSNNETHCQSKDVLQKDTQNPYVHIKKLTQQKIRTASSGVAKVKRQPHGRPTALCSICSQSFVNQSILNIHFERDHKLLPFPRKHFLRKQFSCKVCKKGFNDSSHLWRHVRTLHKTERLEYRRQPSKFKPNAKVCTICHNSYADNSSLIRHTRLMHAKNVS